MSAFAIHEFFEGVTPVMNRNTFESALLITASDGKRCPSKQLSMISFWHEFKKDVNIDPPEPVNTVIFSNMFGSLAIQMAADFLRNSTVCF